MYSEKHLKIHIHDEILYLFLLQIEFVDIAGIVKGASEGAGLGVYIYTYIYI
jgi:ribosome-binding ATPase YchF (GTP1/OBG family)